MDDVVATCSDRRFVAERRVRAPTIMYVGPFTFPADSADSIRVLGMAEAIAAGGARVIVGSGGHGDPAEIQLANGRVISSEPLGEFPPTTRNKLRRVWGGFWLGGKTARWLRNRAEKPDAIVVYGTHFGYLVRLIPWARRNRIPIFIDVVEWYEPSHLPGGRFGPFSIANAISMRLLVPRADGVFCISEYLADYYRGRGCRTLNVPPLFASMEVARRERDPRRILLCFAGSIGGKDALTIRNAVTLMAEAPFFQAMALHLVGPSKGDVEILTGGPIPDNVTCVGRVTRSAAVDVVASADFIVLQRPLKRYAAAGFPSKVAESLMVGTPVITNVTSDLAKYLTDGFNAILLEGDSLDAMRSGLLRAIEHAKFDAQAIASDASRSFAPTSAIEPIRNFLRTG